MKKNTSSPSPNMAKHTPLRAESREAHSNGNIWKAGKSSLIFILAFVYLIPVIVLILTSFKTHVQIMEKGFGWIFMPTLANYSNVLLEQNFLRYLTNSLIVGLVATFFTLLFGGFASYALVRFNFIGKGTISLSTLLIRMIPPAVLVVPIYVLWSYFRLSDTLLGLIIIYVGLNLPFTIWVLISFISDVPVELEESAVVDGCGPWKIFFLIIIPLIKPGLAAAAIFTFRIAWNEFILALVLTNRLTRTLPVATTIYLTDTGIEWGNITAMGTLVALPAIIFTFLAAKQIIAGLTAGAVKG
ncbi:MAG: carbohydrate ABC transporter permease [Deltaproteobacteria bacterium]|jgi:multiple sugar transport system permease protein|nr:carbohydrate ABC transporter permease [Deltaproteobacteria bacterium]